MPSSEAITEFQKFSQEIYICYSVAVTGMEAVASNMLQQNPDRTKSLLIGDCHPSEGSYHGSMNIGKYLDAAQKNGAFSDTLIKSFITTIYSVWDEYYRHLIANECNVEQKSIKSDLMGDIRLIRHCIVHKKSVVTDEGQRLKVLQWNLVPGDLVISQSMFMALIVQINGITVRVQ